MQAKDAKASPPGAHGERYTSQGIAFSEIDRVNAAAKLAEENMHKEINQIVKKSFQNNSKWRSIAQFFVYFLTFDSNCSDFDTGIYICGWKLLL